MECGDETGVPGGSGEVASARGATSARAMVARCIFLCAWGRSVGRVLGDDLILEGVDREKSASKVDATVLWVLRFPTNAQICSVLDVLKYR